MKLLASIVLVLFAGVQAANLVSAQVRTDAEKKPDSSSTNQKAVNSAPENKPEMISIQLVGGGRLEVEELRETSEGFWYKRGGVTTLLDPKRVAHVERPSANHTKATSPPVQDPLRWSLADSKKVENFFFTRFGRPLPTSA